MSFHGTWSTPIDYSGLLEKVMKKQTMTQRFYKTDSPRKSSRTNFVVTLMEATEQAKKFLEENPNVDETYVVEIVRIIRGQKAPIEVIETR